MGRSCFYRLVLDAFRLFCSSLGYGTTKVYIMLYCSCDGGCGTRYTHELKVPCIAVFCVNRRLAYSLGMSEFLNQWLLLLRVFVIW